MVDAPGLVGVGEQELLARLAPAHYRRVWPRCRPVAGSSSKAPKKVEGRCAQSPGRAEGVVRVELKAAAGDQRGRIGLGGDIVEFAERARAGVCYQLC
jgi:hypothetical protein